MRAVEVPCVWVIRAARKACCRLIKRMPAGGAAGYPVVPPGLLRFDGRFPQLKLRAIVECSCGTCISAKAEAKATAEAQVEAEAERSNLDLARPRNRPGMKRMCGANVPTWAGGAARLAVPVGGSPTGTGGSPVLPCGVCRTGSRWVKPGQTKSNHFLIHETGKTRANIGDLHNLHFLQILRQNFKKVGSCHPSQFEDD
jgi:hypothetical protein